MNNIIHEEQAGFPMLTATEEKEIAYDLACAVLSAAARGVPTWESVPVAVPDVGAIIGLDPF